jgi:hypothetical protein
MTLSPPPSIFFFITSDLSQKTLSDSSELSTSLHRPLTVTFNLSSSSSTRSRDLFCSVSRPITSLPQIATADVSHITDHSTTTPGASFIPSEFTQEIQNAKSTSLKHRCSKC